MSLGVLACALAVAGVFGVAGVAKLAHPQVLQRSLTASGLSERLARWGARTVPIVEVIVAIGLIATPTRRVAAVAAVLLLMAFSGWVLAQLLRGRRASCGCFGSLGRTEVTYRTLLRNVALLAGATTATATPVSWEQAARAADTGALTLALMVAVGGLTAALVASIRLQLQLVRRYGEVLLALEAPRDPSASTREHRAADSVVTEVDGDALPLSSLWAGAERGAVLVFSDPHCATCLALLPEVARWSSRLSGVGLAVVSPSMPARKERGAAGDSIRWLVDGQRRAFEALAIRGTPSAVLVGRDGHVRERVEGAPAVAALVRSLATQGLSLGDVDVLDGQGRTVRLADVAIDRPVLFWDRDCPFCHQLLQLLEARDRPSEASAMLIVRGRPGAAAVPRGWPVVYDPDVLAEQVAGAPGTPSLVALGDGRADVAVGVSAVLKHLDAASRHLAATTGGRR